MFRFIVLFNLKDTEQNRHFVKKLCDNRLYYYQLTLKRKEAIDVSVFICNTVNVLLAEYTGRLSVKN